MKLLSEAEYLATCAGPMKQLSTDDEMPFQFWDYFDAIPSADFQEHDCSAGSVTYAWKTSTGAFQHVLVNSEDKNVFMVLVLDVANRCVLGHRLLDLNREYGLVP